MRSLLAAILSPFRSSRAERTPPPLTACPSASALRPAPARRTPPPNPPDDVITADGMPLVRPYVVVWERERDERERHYYAPWEAAV
ncbi:hypothetical protein ACF073_02715 [Streptomyces sp. NPDC015171]|uniref:hypothetical protein n=1 Tax=Streptomyces sp. NPDC015171 TaxID=3364945 RepID=UPI0037015AC0